LKGGLSVIPERVGDRVTPVAAEILASLHEDYAESFGKAEVL
jgi:hypothetical protein